MGNSKWSFEAECKTLLSNYSTEASRLVMQAFVQGYLLGKKHGKKVLEEGGKDEN